ncbi:GHKL domain-containing protein [Gracilibacillus oryzae]|uniref:GHKL domain-containing protein n=1 Tax=Gracilibacillus oryzae TaxID=1672701 RepID=A0A7C8GTN5_9BACI|nr:GHKL domain-containing protein [Gracilibacillus oryzae]KAB8137736.1 GHKL domain-containing protein [Gracilibacillus oryzae]
MIPLYINISLDVLSIFCIIYLVGRDKISLNLHLLKWFLFLWLYCYFDSLQWIGQENFIIFPVQSRAAIAGLFVLILFINSFIMKASHIEIVFLTLFVYVIWFLIRLASMTWIDFAGWSETLLPLLTVGISLTVVILEMTTFKQYLISELTSFVKIIIVCVFGLLFYIVLTSVNQQQLIISPALITFIVIVLLAVFCWMVYEQRQSQIMRNRLKVIEEYIPIIDDLVAEVRSRQHEFSNKLLAISSVLHSSENMDQARLEVEKYIENVQLTKGQYELLNMDHKVIAGFLYTKMKRAEQSNIVIKIDRSVPVDSLPCEDYDLIEILGILVDNAIEACYGGESIVIKFHKRNARYELTVSNPGEYISNDQFMQFFKLGYSTKSTYSKDRGYGLYNVQQIAKQYNGKVIARNEQMSEMMVTIGVQF